MQQAELAGIFLQGNQEKEIFGIRHSNSYGGVQLYQGEEMFVGKCIGSPGRTVPEPEAESVKSGRHD